MALPQPPKNLPKIEIYNRLEGRPRRDAEDTDFTDSLRVEVQDALWMLTRQWQFGEFKADDAGSAIDIEVNMDKIPTEKIGGKNYDKDQYPIESIVEAEFMEIDLKLHMQITKVFKRFINEDKEHKKTFEYYIKNWPLTLSDIEPFEYDRKNYLLAKRLVQKRKLLNGELLIKMIIRTAFNSKNSNNRPFGYLLAWLQKSYGPTAVHQFWQNDRLEYQFEVQNNSQNISLSAKEYYHGRLDWSNMNIHVKEGQNIDAITKKKFLLPTQVSFSGMPADRWWEFEDAQLNFAKTDVELGDITTLLFLEFGLVYNNDWMVIPFTIPYGHLCKISSLKVTDVFGEITNILPINSNADWDGWDFFSLTKEENVNEKEQKAASNIEHGYMYLPSVLPSHLESKPIEKVAFIRDEQENVVWAIEEIIPDLNGTGMNGYEISKFISSQKKDETQEVKKESEEDSLNDRKIYKYQLLSAPLQNYFPFEPEAIDTNETNNQMILQKNDLPTFENEILPKGKILKETNKIQEEEIPSIGIEVTRSFQRTRWHNGKVVLWLGRKKVAGTRAKGGDLRLDWISEIE